MNYPQTAGTRAKLLTEPLERISDFTHAMDNRVVGFGEGQAAGMTIWYRIGLTLKISAQRSTDHSSRVTKQMNE